MPQPLRHLLRLLAILRILARHDALFPFERLPLPRFVWRLLQLFGGRRSRRSSRQRPGQRLAAALHELGPSFIKLGQALSVRADLVGEALAGDLGALRDRLPPFAAAAARSTIESELGRPIEQLFSRFEDQPVAAASIAQVHFATTPEAVEVAVKVLRPGIEAAFQRDLALLFWLARLAERLEPSLRRLRPVDVVRTLSDSVAIEMDLRMEAAAASELAANFAADPGFRVPAVDWPRTGRRVLTLQRVDGIPIDDRQSLIEAGHDVKEIAAIVIRTFLNQALRDGFFHADMHHGNLFVAADCTLVAVDFGIMGRIDLPTRRFMAELLHAFLIGDWQRAAEVHFEAGYVPPGKSVAQFAQACRSIGEPILGRAVNEISIGRLLAQLFQITATFDMQTQPQLLLLQKTMVTAEGVARSLDPEVNFWAVAEQPVSDWLTANMAPEALLARAAADAFKLGRRLPQLAARFEAALTRTLDQGLRLDPESLRILAEAQARQRQPLLWAIAAIAALLLLLWWQHG